MSYYLNEAASDIRDLMSQTLEAPKSKLYTRRILYISFCELCQTI